MTEREFTFLCGFGGSGGQAIGLLRSQARLFGETARFRCLGSIDFNAAACEDFERFTGSKAVCADVMAVGAFWAPWMMRAAFGQRRPDAVVLSGPCKGASRLLAAAKSRTQKYRQMNRLSVVFIEAVLDAWRDDPPPMFVLENVPGLPTRARAMLRSLRSLLREAGYVFHASTHDCGEIGGLAQHRERYLLVARRPKSCPPLLYQPPKKRVRACGEVLETLPVPATPAAAVWGDLHTLPRIEWRNWLRLALIPAGGDWRDLPGVLKAEQERREVFRRHAVAEWEKPIEAVTGPGGHTVGAIADPRANAFYNVDRVYGFDQPVHVITASPSPSSGRPAVADHRWHAGAWGVFGWRHTTGAITGGADNPSRGRFALADPRIALDPDADRHWNKLAVTGFDDPVGTVLGKPQPSSGGPSVADPRLEQLRVPVGFDAAYAVLRPDSPARAIAGKASVGCGAYAIADGRDRTGIEARLLTLDEALDLDLPPRRPPPFVPVIVARDGTWHRPLTLLELAVLQSYPLEVRGERLRFAGKRVQIAEHIGNSIPPDAFEAVGDRLLVALLEAANGGFSLASSSTPVWVLPPMEMRT